MTVRPGLNSRWLSLPRGISLSLFLLFFLLLFHLFCWVRRPRTGKVNYIIKTCAHRAFSYALLKLSWLFLDNSQIRISIKSFNWLQLPQCKCPFNLSSLKSSQNIYSLLTKTVKVLTSISRWNRTKLYVCILVWIYGIYLICSLEGLVTM